MKILWVLYLSSALEPVYFEFVIPIKVLPLQKLKESVCADKSETPKMEPLSSTKDVLEAVRLFFLSFFFYFCTAVIPIGTYA